MGILRKFREWREDKDGTLIGPDIEAELVNTDDLLYGSSRKEVKQIESFDEDTDGSTDLDLEVSVDVTDRNYEFELIFVLTDPPSSTGDLLLTFNNSSSSVSTYDQITINGSDFNGGSEFQTGISDTKAKSRFLLFSKFRPNIMELTQAHSKKSIDRAQTREIKGSQLSSIQIFTDGLACAGRVYVVEVSDQ